MGGECGGGGEGVDEKPFQHQVDSTLRFVFSVLLPFAKPRFHPQTLEHALDVGMHCVTQTHTAVATYEKATQIQKYTFFNSTRTFVKLTAGRFWIERSV